MSESKYESEGMTRDIDFEFELLEEVTFLKAHQTRMNIDPSV